MNDITASEAVFGFAAWLTAREEAFMVGAKYDAAPMAELAGQWCKANKILLPRADIYPNNITQPK